MADNAAGRDRRSQDGQAVVEMALVLPLGLLLLFAVGYIGRGLLERQAMLGAARYAAREAALEATRSPAHKAVGTGVQTQAGGAANRAAHIRAAAGGRPAESAPPRWDGVYAVPTKELRPVPLGGYGVAFRANHKELVDGTTLEFGIGFVLYGARAKTRLTFLEPVRKATLGASRANANPAKGLESPLEVSGAAYMPGELPAKHPGVGLVDINPWIRRILEE